MDVTKSNETALDQVKINDEETIRYDSNEYGDKQVSISPFTATFEGFDISGRFCTMPYHDRYLEVFAWRAPYFNAIARERESGETIAITRYPIDGISRTDTPVDIPDYGRKNEQLSYSMETYLNRIKALRKQMAEDNFDALLITDLHDIVYLTGYNTEGGTLLCLVIELTGEPFLVGRYLELGDARLLNGSNAYEKSLLSEWWCYEDSADPIEALHFALDAHNLKDKRIGFEARGLGKGDEIEHYKLIKGMIDLGGVLTSDPNAKLKDYTLIDLPGYIEQFRLIKTPEQIERTQEAGRLSEIGIKAGIAAVKPGVTDREIIAHILYAMMMAGSRVPAYGPFVSIGPASAMGHCTAQGHKVKKGDLVCIEVSGSFERIHCASMQMCYVGTKLPPWLEEAEAILGQIFEEVFPLMTPGTPARLIHAKVNEIYSRSKFWYTRYARSTYTIGGMSFPQDWADGSFSCSDTNYAPLQEGLVQHFIPWASTPFGAYFKSVTIQITPTGAKPLMGFSPKVHLIN